MSDGDAAKTLWSTDRIALLVSILAMLATGGTLYYQFLQGPVIRAYPPPTVYLSKENQLGIPVSFTNSGTAADVIIGGSVELSRNSEAQPQALNLRWVSPFEQQFGFAGGKWTEADRVYLPFMDLLLKAGEPTEQVFWFQPTSGNFAFQVGLYTACAHFVTAGTGPVRPGVRTGRRQAKPGCSATVSFNLTQGLLNNLISGSQDGLAIETE